MSNCRRAVRVNVSSANFSGKSHFQMSPCKISTIGALGLLSDLARSTSRISFFSSKIDISPNTQEQASAEIRGNFVRTKSWVNSAGDFLVDFFGPFFLEKGGKNPPKNPQQNSNQNLGVPRPNPSHCKDPAGLDKYN